MKKQMIGAAVLASAFASAASASVLWNNGTFVTHPGGHNTGADASVVGSDVNAFGFNAGTFGGGSYFRRADDFAVGGAGWSVNAVTVYLYSTNAQLTDTPWSSVNMNIWSGTPGDGGVVVGSSTGNSQAVWTNAYRVSATAMGNTARAVFAIDVFFDDLLLAPGGNYWIDFQAQQNSGFSAWVPPVMDVDGDGNVTTRAGNSMQISHVDGVPTEWHTYVHDSGNSVELPFLIHGSVLPGPGALALLGLAGLVGARRRRA